MEKKIAILGGGFSGLMSIASLKEEGFDPICFEKTDQIGGTWFYREESVDGVPSIMATTILNHSKEIGAISNFPPRKECNNYMRHSEMYRYFLEFVEAKDIMRHVRLNSEVVQCRKAEDYAETGRWSVTVKDVMTEEESTAIYDAVIVAVGHMNRKKWASYPFQETFKGRLMHTHSLKGVSSFQGQNVVVVGMGCSALDAAVETSRVAKQVYLSTRSGAHVFSRVGPSGYPFDYASNTRFTAMFADVVPKRFSSWCIRKMYLDPVFSYKLYTVEPKHHVLAKPPVVNDSIASKLLSGEVVQKRDVARFTEEGVVFEGDEQETKADVVIMGSGYDWKFPFLEEGIVTQEKDLRINLYKCIWPPQLVHPTLAVIGFLLPFGPGFPLAELQCRWVARILAEKCRLPSEKEMVTEIQKKHNRNLQTYAPSEKISLQVLPGPYMDEIASLIGAKPDLLRLLFTDVWLFYKVMFGAFVPYQYRLNGPHPWKGAREAILTVDERVLYPLQKLKNHGDMFPYLKAMLIENYYFEIILIFFALLFFACCL